MRFKEGDMVRIICNTKLHHGFDIGSVVVIEHVDNSAYKARKPNNIPYWFVEEDCEPVLRSIKLKIKQL